MISGGLFDLAVLRGTSRGFGQTAKRGEVSAPPRGPTTVSDQLAVAEDRSTDTPGPMVDESETFFR